MRIKINNWRVGRVPTDAIQSMSVICLCIKRLLYVADGVRMRRSIGSAGFDAPGLASKGYAASIMIDGCSISNRLDLLVLPSPVWGRSGHVTAAVWLSALCLVVSSRLFGSFTLSQLTDCNRFFLSIYLFFFLSFFHVRLSGARRKTFMCHQLFDEMFQLTSGQPG